MRMITKRLVGAIALSFAVAPLVSGAQRGLLPEDVYRFEVPNDPHLSPDGKRVTFVIATIDAQRKRRNTVWIGCVDGSEKPRRYTSEAQSANSPRFSPDGRTLAFLSSRAGETGHGADKTQVYVLSMDGGEARRVTSLPNGVASFAWAPDGKHFACVAKTDPAPDTEVKFERSDSRRYTMIDYKFDGIGWFDGKRNHIYVVDVASGKAKQVTQGDGWDDTGAAWSPDGARVAFVSDRTSLGKDYASRHSDVYVVSAEGGEPVKVSDHDEADTAPVWSPDGKTIAFLGSLSEGDHPKVWLAPSTGGERSVLAAPKMDALAGGLEWGDAGRGLYYEAGVRGNVHLFRIDLASKAITEVTSGDRRTRFIDRNEEARRMVYRVEGPGLIGDLFVADLDGKNEKRLTHFNDAVYAEVRFAPVERVAWKGPDGLDIEGFLVKPLDFAPGHTYPMVSWFHGGPNGMHGFEWSTDVQVLAAHGYAVFLPNHRGSSGYGEAFQRAVVNEWGGKAYLDIQYGIDSALKANPWIDKGRLGIAGHSFGGFMTMWTTTQTTRFKAAIAIAGISNLVSIQGTRDAAFSHRRDFGGDLYLNYDRYWNYSAYHYAPRVKTPTLILHGEADHRVPLEQGEEWFRALKHVGVETELVVFPRGSHGFRTGGEAKQVVETLNWQLYWFDKFLGR